MSVLVSLVMAMSARALSITAFHGPAVKYRLTQLTVGADGAIWFVGLGSPAVGRMAPDGTFSSFPAPADESAIGSGPDGALWIAGGCCNLARMTTTGSVFTFPPSNINGFSQLLDVLPGPDGRMWALMRTGGLRGVKPRGGEIASVSADGQVRHLLNLSRFFHNCVSAGGLARQGATMWFSFALSRACSGLPRGVEVGQLLDNGHTRHMRLMREVAGWRGVLSGAGHTLLVTRGPTLWLSAYRSPRSHVIVRVGVKGRPRYFPVGDSGFGPAHLAIGSDGAVWFLTDSGRYLGRLSPSGRVTKLRLPLSSQDQTVDLIAGPQNTLWVGAWRELTPASTYNRYSTTLLRISL